MTKSISLLFGSEAKVKIIRLFVFSPGIIWTAAEIAQRIKERRETARRELRLLVKAGFLKKRVKGYALNPSYPHLEAIEDFFIKANPMSRQELTKRLSKAGALKFIVISGVFLHDRDSRIDLLVVGDHLKENKLQNTISSIEAELGMELRYTAFETADFKYRLSIYDKLVRDILDSTHQKVLNRLGI